MISYIIFYPELIDIVRIETDRAFDNDGRVNFHYLNESCPRLSAIWNETIRLTTSSASVRHLSADTIIGGKILRKNNRVMIPYRQLHFNEEVFGKDVHRFDPDRFLKNEALQRSSSWRPFGGGITMCPGRFGCSLLQYEVAYTTNILISCETSCGDRSSNAFATIRCRAC